MRSYESLHTLGQTYGRGSVKVFDNRRLLRKEILRIRKKFFCVILWHTFMRKMAKS